MPLPKGGLAGTAARARSVEGVAFGRDARSLAVRLRLCVAEYTTMCRSLKVPRIEARALSHRVDRGTRRLSTWTSCQSISGCR
jgi:hypothetical protein